MILNYKKRKQLLWDTDDTILKKITVENQCLPVAEILEGKIDKNITIDTNNCGYSGTLEDLIVNYIHFCD